VKLLFPHEYCITRLLAETGSFFRGIGDRSFLHHQLPCSWTSKNFTSAKNFVGDAIVQSLESKGIASHTGGFSI
jgi:hypothetical protein